MCVVNWPILNAVAANALLIRSTFHDPSGGNKLIHPENVSKDPLRIMQLWLKNGWFSQYLEVYMSLLTLIQVL